MAACEEEGCVV